MIPSEGMREAGVEGVPGLLRTLLEAAVNRGVAWLDPDTFHRFEALEGKVVALRVTPTGQAFFLGFGEKGIVLLDRSPTHIDVTIESTPLAIIRLLATSSVAQGRFPADVTITGDVSVAEQVKAIVGRLQVDWEEQLSHVIGDIAAHELGRVARTFHEWSRNAQKTLLADMGEYLSEEIRLVPARSEINAFVTAVDVIRDDVERIEKRIARAQGRTERRP